MEKLVLFPLNDDTEVLLNNLKRNNQYEIVAISSYYEDKKRLELLQNKNLFHCSINFEDCLNKADAVVFAENTMEHNYDGYKNRIMIAQRSGKKIYLSSTLLDILKIDIRSNNFHILQEKALTQDLADMYFKEIDIPIISIMGLGKNCDKFKLQVEVKRLIEKNGYNVLSICSNVLGKFLGMEILPGFLYSCNISYPEKIKAFNSWVYHLQKQSTPDLIILGCSGGILEFEEYETNYYGEVPLIISNAVSVDAGLVTLYANSEQDNDSAKRLRDFCQMKYNTIVQDYVMSEQYFKADFEWKKIRYYKTQGRNYTEYRGENIAGCHITCIEDVVEIEGQVKTILNRLENNFHVI